MRYLLTFCFLLLAAAVFTPATGQMANHTFNTERGALRLIPVQHASHIWQWNGLTIYVDPAGDSSLYAGHPKPDLILITDIHGDHLDQKLLGSMKLEGVALIAPQAVIEQADSLPFSQIYRLANSESLFWRDIDIKAVPMYNLPEADDAFHPKGRGNGYVLRFDDTKIYISGDTEGIPEMRQLRDIDVALVAMNLPYTMPVDQAADGVLAFKPKVVYPYHYRGRPDFSDVEKFKQMVNEKTDKVEVRLANWYPNR
jgi:L-ascorbate metabolism protein UlaG (beta-lactamase superfamily)